MRTRIGRRRTGLAVSCRPASKAESPLNPSAVRILIVEDEPLIAMMLEELCESLGYRLAGTVDDVTGALDAIAAGEVDLAILDLHLSGRAPSWPVADRLDGEGIPFLLASGGQPDDLPARHAARPFLAKPFTMDGVQEAIERALEAPKK